MNIQLLDPFANMNEEIEGVFQQWSGEPKDELAEIIENKHNQLLQNIANQVDESLQLQEAVQQVIDGLTDESTGIHLTSEAKSRVKDLRGILVNLKQEESSLTCQLKTSAASLKILQSQIQELRKTAGALQVAILKAPPKYSALPPNIITGGKFASMTVARKGTR
jgi:t-SNARE complex subunit (syntaxin)